MKKLWRFVLLSSLVSLSIATSAFANSGHEQSKNQVIEKNPVVAEHVQQLLDQIKSLEQTIQQQKQIIEEQSNMIDSNQSLIQELRSKQDNSFMVPKFTADMTKEDILKITGKDPDIINTYETANSFQQAEEWFWNYKIYEDGKLRSDGAISVYFFPSGKFQKYSIHLHNFFFENHP